MKFKITLKRKDYDSVTLFFTLLLLIASTLTSCTSHKSLPTTPVPRCNTLSPVISDLPQTGAKGKALISPDIGFMRKK
jgi:hypothetical protein